MSSTYPFTYSMTSNETFSASLYTGRYGSEATCYNLVTNGSVLDPDPTSVAAEIARIQAVATNITDMCILENMVSFPGDDVTYGSYEATNQWYTIPPNSKGTITFTTTTITDNFYICTPTLDLSKITITVTGNAQATNVYIISTTLSGLSSNATTYPGNFITKTITGTSFSTEAYIFGSMNLTSTTVPIPVNLLVRLGVPQYVPQYAALALTNISGCTINGAQHGVVNGTSDVAGSSVPLDPTNVQNELAQITTFFNSVASFLENTFITSTTILGSQAIPRIGENTYIRIESNITAELTVTGSNDTCYIMVADGVDLSNVTFTNDSTTVKLYVLGEGSMTVNNTAENVVFIAQGDITCAPSATFNTPMFSLTGSIIGQGATITFGAVDPYPAYTFSFAAITAYKLNNLVIHGGKYGASIIGSNVTPINSQLDDVSAELAAIQDFKTYLLSNETMPQASYDGMTDVTMTSGIWYTVTIPSFGTRTVTFDGESKTDANFYWYKTGGNLDLYYIDFRFINNAQPSNLYIICDADIFLYNSTNYGNLVAEGIVALEPSTVYGTVTALAANETITVSNTLTVFFGTECFMRGTKILTDRWYVPIEELKVGDLVMTHGAVHDNKGHVVGDNLAVPIRSLLKYSRKSCRSSAPIVITKNAFAPNKPFEDLYASPNHGIVDRQGKLSPISHFLNDTSIFQDPTVDLITYYHLDLGGHYVITANGVLTESWLDPKK